MQLSFQPSDTPASLTIEVRCDPFDPADDLSVGAIVRNPRGDVLAAARITLPGLEADYADSAVEAVLNSFRFGSPTQDLRPALGRIKRAASAHRKRHQRD